MDESDDEDTMPCPYCRRDIYGDAERCPYCERYISEEDGVASRKPWWLILGVLASLYVIYLWITGV